MVGVLLCKSFENVAWMTTEKSVQINQVGTRSGGRCDTRPSRIITYYHTKEAFSLVIFIRWYMCRMGRRSFWYRFDENRSTFDEDMREKFSFPVTFRPQICFPSYSCPALSLVTKLYVSKAFPFRENRRHGTDGQTDGVQHLMQS